VQFSLTIVYTLTQVVSLIFLTEDPYLQQNRLPILKECINVDGEACSMGSFSVASHVN
jgi:hypothetical protein